MRTIVIAVAPPGSSDFATHQVDIEFLRRLGEYRAVIDLSAGHRIAAILGNGYGEKAFHLDDGEMRYEACRIVRMGRDCTLDFMRAGLIR